MRKLYFVNEKSQYHDCSETHRVGCSSMLSLQGFYSVIFSSTSF